MKTRWSIAITLLLMIALVVACKMGGGTGNSEGTDSINLGDVKPLVHTYDTLGEGLPIFYNMYLSVELSTLFQASGAVFKSEVLNPTEKMTDYVTSSKKALNLGIYAVDLTYAKAFEQFDAAAKYFNAMEKMAEELGIPADYFESSAQRFDKNINMPDSLMVIANEVYMATDSYLRENERYAAAGQIILGGWIEALHLAVDMANSTRDIDVIERLAEQKASLANVIAMLNDYSDDVVIKDNLKKLNQLKPVFDSFVVKLDPNFKATSPEGKKIIQQYLVKVNEIGAQIKAIRKEIVS